MTTPYYQHDCDSCEYLASERNGFRVEVDWYVCTSPTGRTLIRRFGNEGGEYESGTIGETVVPQRIVLAAFAKGFEFTDAELVKFGRDYLKDRIQKLDRAALADIPGEFDCKIEPELAVLKKGE